MRTLGVIAGLLGLVLGWNAPNHYPPWPAFHLEMFAGIGLAMLGLTFVVWPARGGPTGRHLVSAAPHRLLLPPPSAWVWMAAGAWPVLQWATGQLAFRGDAVIAVLYGLGMGFGIHVGRLAAARHGRGPVLQALWLTLLLAALAANAFGLAQALGLPPRGWWAMELIDDRPFANFGQPNHYGLAMVFGIVAAVALYELGAVRRRGVLAAAVAFLGTGVMASGSRSCLLALGLLILLALALQRRTATRLTRADLTWGAGGLLLMAAALPPLLQALRLPAPTARALADVGPREAIWRHFLAAIEAQPWSGHGFNQGVAALAAVADRVAPSRNTVFAHNVVLDLMTWFGVPLALAMTGLLALWIGRWLRPTPEPLLRARRLPVAALWLALAVQSMLEFPFAHAYFLLPGALLAGAVTAWPAPGGQVPGALITPRFARWAATGVRALAVAAVALFALFVVEYLQMESDFRFLRFDRANFTTKVVHDTRDDPWLLDQLAALNASARRVPRPGMSAADLERSRVLARRFHIPSVRMDHAQALALNGRRAEAEHELRIIRSVNAPAHFARIESQWRQWLHAHADVTGAPPLPAAAP